MAGHTALSGSGCAENTSFSDTGSAAHTSLFRAVGVPTALPSGCANSTSLRPVMVLQEALPSAGQWVCQQHFPLGVPTALPTARAMVHGGRLPHDCGRRPGQDQLAKGHVPCLWPEQELHQKHPRPSLALVLPEALSTRPV
jgi:hypothetical protein